jgi:hypothetical protein
MLVPPAVILQTGPDSLAEWHCSACCNSNEQQESACKHELMHVSNPLPNKFLASEM